MIWFVVPQYRLHITERDPPHRIEWLRRRVRCRSHGHRDFNPELLARNV